MDAVNENKFWTYLIVGLIGFFVVLPVGASALTAFISSIDAPSTSDVDMKPVMLALAGLLVVGVVVVILFSLGSGSGKHGSGQRELTQAQRDLARAVESVRAHHAQRMYAEQQDQPRRFALARADLLALRAQEDGKWLTPAEATEEGIDV